MKSRFNCYAAIEAYLARGIPRSKIVMGLALYGHGWQGNNIYIYISLT